jgi:tellurite resistance protein TerC
VAELWNWVQSPEALVLIGFHVFVIAMLALDLGVFQRHAHVVSMKEAAIWSAVWVALSLLFAAAIWRYWDVWRPNEPDQGSVKAIEFITGYLIEKSLSVDNLFVFLVIFRYFAVPRQMQHRVLYWGILGALVMRAAMILAGAALLHKFHWMIYVFGAFLLYTAYKMYHSVEAEIDPGRNPLLRLAKRFLPVVDKYDSSNFWVKRGGKWYATPLPLVLLVVESTDVVFAVDSIPAIFAITTDTFIVYTSNVFAILGLRALFFLLAGFLGMFRYLSTGLALVLGFVGIKMLIEEPLRPFLDQIGVGKQTTILISLAVVATILTVSVVASLIAARRDHLEPSPPEEATDDPTIVRADDAKESAVPPGSHGA